MPAGTGNGASGVQDNPKPKLGGICRGTHLDQAYPSLDERLGCLSILCSRTKSANIGE
jgi:hypothetical protein